MKRVRLESPSLKRADEFLDAVSRSRALYKNRATPPSTPDRYKDFVKNAKTERRACFFVVDDTTDDLAGVANITEIVRGSFQSAYLATTRWFLMPEKAICMLAWLRHSITRLAT